MERRASFVANTSKSGQQIGVVGQINTRNYDDKDGKKVYVTEVFANEVYFADGKQNTTTEEFTPNVDDLPF